ncbi:phage protein [Pectobacterium actinidiae]|uniref:phage protein n=1 Tax=Pectobacterium actinidiae TaxID=1507808 RepID=UPI004040B299
MSVIFGRSYKLVIKSSMGGSDLVYEPPMQIRFSVAGTPNNHETTANISIYGISRATRQRLYREYDEIFLYAGYVGNMGMVFRGQINNIETGKDGVSTYIRFYCWSHFDKWKGVSINKTWGNNTPPIEIVRDVANTFDIDVDIVGNFSQLPLAIYGDTRIGKSVDEMNDLKRIYGFEWFFESNRIVIAKSGYSREKITHIIRSDNGMEGVPRIYLGQIEVDVKLDHRIRILDWVDVASEFETYGFSDIYRAGEGNASRRQRSLGKFAVLSTMHQGDFYGDLWKTTVSALLRIESARGAL